MALLERACDEVIARWGEDERRGHPALFALRARQVRRDARALVTNEADKRPFAPHLPSYFEREFSFPVPPPDGDPAAPLHLGGKIDRVDMAAGAAVVIDYKTGRKKRYQRLLNEEELLVTSFQLPIYALAAREVLGADRVQAAYYAIRDGEPTKTVGGDKLGAGDDPFKPSVAAAVWALYRRMLAGDFAVRPRTCENCGLEAACRVVVPLLPEEP
jgi:ATP-dependent exoDNAse (exonuclease V) beta subunit